MIKIFLKGLSIYFKNFFAFSRVMLFPVFGQVIGIFLILGPTYFYRQYFASTIPLLGLIVAIIPGFAIFLKAFWDYMIVCVSLNTMVADTAEKGSFGNFKIHNGAVSLRTNDYVVLLLLISLIWIALLFVPFLLVYFSLCFQIFAFEAATPMDVVKKSCNMIKNNFWKAFVLAIAVYILTGLLIPTVVQELIRYTPIMSFITAPFEAYINILIVNPFSWLPETVALLAVGSIVSMFTLPLGSACYTLFYQALKDQSKSRSTQKQ